MLHITIYEDWLGLVSASKCEIHVASGRVPSYWPACPA